MGRQARGRGHPEIVPEHASVKEFVVEGWPGILRFKAWAGAKTWRFDNEFVVGRGAVPS